MNARDATVERSEPSQGAAPFSDVLCAIDGSRASVQAARYAIVLAQPDAALQFIAVSRSTGAGLVEMANLGESRAESALKSCARRARKAGLSASIELRKHHSPSDALLAAADDHDLLVVGSRGGSRAGGIMIGSTTTQIAHRATKPLLVARRASGTDEFLQTILVASDGSAGSWEAARAASRIARAHGSDVKVVYVPQDTDPERHRMITEQLAAIRKATGAEPTVIDSPGHVAEQIAETARSTGSTLIAIGHRGVGGLRALGSVSERVLHAAPCSVLVVPATNRGER